jgi:hypothetical protein
VISALTPGLGQKQEVAAFPEHFRSDPQQRTFVEASGTSVLFQQATSRLSELEHS